MTDIVDRGREAWSQIHRATSFDAWKAICQALAIGRQHALHEAGANAPHGAKYWRSFIAWLAANGFASMPFGLRASCLRVADNLDAIEAWRAGLPDDVRASMNNPQVILRNWRKSGGADKSGHGAMREAARMPKAAAPRHITSTGRHGRAIYWPQDAIRRAASALRELRSTDCYVMARVALEAAVRGADDLEELLKPKARASETTVFASPQTFPVINIAR